MGRHCKMQRVLHFMSFRVRTSVFSTRVPVWTRKLMKCDTLWSVFPLIVGAWGVLCLAPCCVWPSENNNASHNKGLGPRSFWSSWTMRSTEANSTLEKTTTARWGQQHHHLWREIVDLAIALIVQMQCGKNSYRSPLGSSNAYTGQLTLFVVYFVAPSLLEWSQHASQNHQFGWLIPEFVSKTGIIYTNLGASRNIGESLCHFLLILSRWSQIMTHSSQLDKQNLG